MTQFCIRPNSGGRGKWKGGNGLIREIEFTEASHASVLCQRRVYSPYGMAGGENGLRGENYLGRRMKDGSLRWINVGGTKEVDLKVGDRIKICTPGGGGYGKIDEETNGNIAKPNGLTNGTHSYANGITNGHTNGTVHIPRANGSLSHYERMQQASN
jgi:5-oxoprolinase (ATP-hydrolysing)